MNNPVIIVGTGRCGSSVLAKFAEMQGWDMGGLGDTTRPECPGGDYEDPIIKAINLGRISAANDADADSAYRVKVWRDALIAYTEYKPIYWGFKHPISYKYIEEFAHLWPGAIFVWAKRALPDVASSFSVHYNRDYASCMTTVRRRQIGINKLLARIHNERYVVDMTERRTSEFLTDFWRKMRGRREELEDLRLRTTR